MARPLLLLLIAAIVSGAAAQTTQPFPFPYCKCTRTSSGAPYRMVLSSQTTTPGGGTRVCYDLTTVNRGATGPCTRYDLRKIEFDVHDTCRGAVDRNSLTFNGEKLSVSYTAFPGQGALTFKIIRGPRNGGSVLGTYDELSKQTTKVCFTLVPGQCSTLSTFCTGPHGNQGNTGGCDFVFFNPGDSCCLRNGGSTPRVPNQPSPPPPPPPTSKPPPGFPYCACTKVVSQNTYTLESLGAPIVGDGNTNYCWNVVTSTEPSSARCVNFDLKKVEIEANPGCRRAVSSVSFNGQSFAPSWASYSNGALVLKVTHGNKPLGLYVDLAKAGTTPLCISLKESSDCPDLSSFCKNGACYAAAFSTDNKCCPITALPMPGR